MITDSKQLGNFLRSLAKDDPFIDTIVLIRMLISRSKKAKLNEEQVLRMVEAVFMTVENEQYESKNKKDRPALPQLHLFDEKTLGVKRKK